MNSLILLTTSDHVQVIVSGRGSAQATSHHLDTSRPLACPNRRHSLLFAFSHRCQPFYKATVFTFFNDFNFISLIFSSHSQTRAYLSCPFLTPFSSFHLKCRGRGLDYLLDLFVVCLNYFAYVFRLHLYPLIMAE